MTLARIWIIFAAWGCVAGWTLSALHALNGMGYLAALALPAVVAAGLRKSWWPAGGFHGPNWRKLWWRFRRPAPLIFLSIAALALLSGIGRLPENGDSNAYRVPRMYHWLSEGGWHWIRTEDSRQNIAGCGYEWLCAPLMLLKHSERLIFLPNLISYCLLPGMLFSFFRRLKVASRSAWHWSWLVATGWCYTFQACSTDNDALSAFFAVAAVSLALRARETNHFADLGLAVLSASFLSTVKPTNLPLLLPCLVAVCPCWRLLWRRPAAATMLALIAVLVSFLPMAYLNWRYTGSWKGFVPEAGPVVWWHWGSALALPSPFWGIVGNIFCLSVQNLLPPFFPWAGAWNQAMIQFQHTALGAHFIPFEAFGRLNRSVSASSAGIGLAVVLVIVVSLFAVGVRKRKLAGASLTITLLCWTPWVALLVFMTKVGAWQSARYIAPYYALLLLPLLLRPGMASLVRRRWWQRLVVGAMLFTLAFAGFHYGRELVPSSVFAWLQTTHRPKFLRILDDYYQARVSVTSYRKFTTQHAAGEKVVGYASICGGLEPGMWQPWGHGRVERILPGDSPQWVRTRGIDHVFIEDAALREKNESIDQWLKAFDAEVVDQMTFTTDPGTPVSHLYFCRLRPSGGLPEPGLAK